MKTLHLLNTQISTITMPTGFMIKLGVPRDVTKIGYKSVDDFFERIKDKKHEGLRSIVLRDNSPIKAYIDYELETQQVISGSAIVAPSVKAVDSILADVVIKTEVSDLERLGSLFNDEPTVLAASGIVSETQSDFFSKEVEFKGGNPPENDKETLSADQLKEHLNEMFELTPKTTEIIENFLQESLDSIESGESILKEGSPITDNEIEEFQNKILEENTYPRVNEIEKKEIEEVITADVPHDEGLVVSEHTSDRTEENNTTFVFVKPPIDENKSQEEPELKVEIDYESKTKSELEAIAVTKRISYNSRTTKAQLIEAIKSKE